MSAGEFSQRPFAAGSLVGLRAFMVVDGWLEGPCRGGRFAPGENRAGCKLTDFEQAFAVGKIPLKVSQGRIVWGPLQFPVIEDHDAGTMACSCGFYAYTDGSNEYHTKFPALTEAVIEGYGICTVGDRGFRCSKARLVALVDKSVVRKRWARAGIVWNTLCAALEVFHLVAGDNRLLSAPLLALFLLALAFSIRDLRRRSKVDQVRGNYPDVPVFSSRKRALAAYPLTVPDQTAAIGDTKAVA